MSRIGKKPIEIPAGVDVKLEDGLLTVTGPKGTLSRKLRSDVKVVIEGSTITLEPASDSKFAMSLWGTYGSHVLNMVTGVQTPYEKKLVIEGVGYRAEMQGTKLILSLGYSHKIEVEPVEGVAIVVEKNVISISGINKELVGQVAAKIRSYRKPEPYKGKGIRYETEIVKRKEGKKTV